MPNIYFFSGPCGCGKTTLSNAFAKHIIDDLCKNQVYLLHGDDLHDGFIDSETSHEDTEPKLNWYETLKFNWECILHIAESALKRGVTVIIDYVIEEELPLLKNLCQKYGAQLYYIVLTASEEAIKCRISSRGDTWLIERALFLKNKLENMQENQGHLFDNTNMSVYEEIQKIDIEQFRVDC